MRYWFVRIVSAVLTLIFLEPAVADGPPDRYRVAVEQLDKLIAREVSDKQLPALSIALVDGQTVIAAKGYGHSDANGTRAATADTVYRIGSVADLFTAIGAMQLVERGVLDPDAPVTRYLPDFHPRNPFGTAITLRQLLSHRSGLVRELPAGGYFERTPAALSSAVESLNKTTLVYEPGARFKYSNAGMAVAGRVIESARKQALEDYIAGSVLQPLAMNVTRYRRDAKGGPDFAAGWMWTEHGREFAAPAVVPGALPGRDMDSSAGDLARFLRMLFNGGKGADGSVLRSETLETMWTPQPAGLAGTVSYGIGFRIDQLDGRRRIGHEGAGYGFAAELAALPDDKLGVVVLASRDRVNGVTARIAAHALRLLLAAKQGTALPVPETPGALDPELARRLAGHWQSGTKAIDLEEFAGRLTALADAGGPRAELRAAGGKWVADDRLSRNLTITPANGRLRIGDDTYERTTDVKPAAAPAKWRRLIGEYGWEHQTLYILENGGKLHALVEWFFDYPLQELPGEQFRLPDYGLLAGEKLIFESDGSGSVKSVVSGGVRFPRRHLDGENGETFRIQPIHPLAELRRAALAARPPVEKGDFRQSDLVELTALEPGIKLDVRYATDNNFLSTPFYTSARAFMQRPAALAVARAHRKLAESGYGLLIFDGYRPWSVTKMFWDATLEKQHIFVADPSKGSRHNRGCAVDLTLYDLRTGKAVEMVGGYDEMSDRSYPQYPGGTSLQRWHRTHLRHAMEAEGFTVYEAEWWHFDYKDWQHYAIGNQTFEELTASKP